MFLFRLVPLVLRAVQTGLLFMIISRTIAKFERTNNCENYCHAPGQRNRRTLIYIPGSPPEQIFVLVHVPLTGSDYIRGRTEHLHVRLIYGTKALRVCKCDQNENRTCHQLLLTYLSME